jgi:hypothetical protein
MSSSRCFCTAVDVHHEARPQQYEHQASGPVTLPSFAAGATAFSYLLLALIGAVPAPEGSCSNFSAASPALEPLNLFFFGSLVVALSPPNEPVIGSPNGRCENV